MELPKIGTIEAYAMIVDINSFTPMVSKSSQSDLIAQFVRDALSGGVDMVQKHGGSVVSFMGDAFLAILDNPDSVYMSCTGIAKDLDRQCEYVSNHQEDYPDDWHYAKGGPSLKISIEYGYKHGMNQWINSGPYSIIGKNNEGEYHYWELDLGDVWREDRIDSGDETYWG
jgi:hypothetical protein